MNRLPSDVFLLALLSPFILCGMVGWGGGRIVGYLLRHVPADERAW